MREIRSKFPAERTEKRKALLREVEKVRDVLAAGSAEAEKMRTLPPASVAALRDTGIISLKTPAVLGGAEADPMTQMDVIEAVSYLDSAAGWWLFVGAATMGVSGAFLPDSGAEQIYTGDRYPTFCGGGGFVLGKLVRTSGGYRLTGRWSYGSGIRHADYITVPGLIEGGSAPHDVRFSVFPTKQAEIIDNWYVMGLEGTGSCDFAVTDLFIPEDFTHMLPNEAPPKRGGPLYRFGFPGFIANENAGFALGVARRALDEVVALAAAKSRGYAKRSSLVNRAVFQRALGEGDLRLRAARALIFDLYEKAWARVCAGETLDPRDHAQLRAAGSWVIDAALAVTTDAFRYAAGSAMRSHHILQKCLRDLQAAGTHWIISDTSYENHGQFMLGLPDADPMN
jgi:alkylation response protein AidB-like acyl-CoA dehydrogenase